MRIEGREGEALTLVASIADLRLLDLAFSELLEHASIDHWAIRTGAPREEAAAVWLGVAGSRRQPVPGFPADEMGGLPISERAVEVIEAVLFEIARARRVAAAGIHSRTGASHADWQRLWREAHRLVQDLDLRPATGQGAGAETPASPWAGGGVRLAGFRQVGGSVAGRSESRTSIARVDAIGLAIGDCTFADVAVSETRLIASRVDEVVASGEIGRSAVIDCELSGIDVSGTLADVRFIGNRYSEVDLRSSLLIGCRFYEAEPGEEVWLPTGRDCFVIPVASMEPALEFARGRIGEKNLRALSAWIAQEEADYVSVGGWFWSQIAERGADVDPEVEEIVLERLHRLRVASLAGAAPAASATEGPSGT